MHMKSSSSTAIAVALASFASPALAGPTYETAGGGTFTYYGQFNPAFVRADDGVDSFNEFGDNASSGSRVGLLITQPFGDNELRFRFETSFGFNPTAGNSQTAATNGVDWTRESIRHVDFQYETARYGTFYIGQGSMASDGVGDLDASGTSLAGAVSVGDIAGGYELRTTGGALSGIAISDAFQSFDGSRRGRVRYDTPSFNGFTFSVAYGQDILTSGNDDDFYDVGISYETEFDNGVDLAAGLGYQVRERTGVEDREDTFASLALGFASGFNLSMSVGDRNTGGDFAYVKAATRLISSALARPPSRLISIQVRTWFPTGMMLNPWGLA